MKQAENGNKRKQGEKVARLSLPWLFQRTSGYSSGGRDEALKKPKTRLKAIAGKQVPMK
jgi:hypothetical protein